MNRPLSRAVQTVVGAAMVRPIAPGAEASRPAVPTAGAPHQEADGVDASAGSEFVDDRIRLRE